MNLKNPMYRPCRYVKTVCNKAVFIYVGLCVKCWGCEHWSSPLLIHVEARNPRQISQFCPTIQADTLFIQADNQHQHIRQILTVFYSFIYEQTDIELRTKVLEGVKTQRLRDGSGCGGNGMWGTRHLPLPHCLLWRCRILHGQPRFHPWQ